MSPLGPSVLGAAAMALSLAAASPAARDVTTVAMTTVTVYLPSANSTVVFTESDTAATPALASGANAPGPLVTAISPNKTITVGSPVPVPAPTATGNVITLDGFTYTEADLSTFSNLSFPATILTVTPSAGNATALWTANGTFTLTVPVPTSASADGVNGKGENANPGSSSKNAGAVETGFSVKRHALALVVAFLLPALAF